MGAYLLKRDGGTYYFRRSIPLASRMHFGGKREWVRSLGTKDRNEAKRLLPGCLIAFDDAMSEQGRGCNNDAVSAPNKAIRPFVAPVASISRVEAHSALKAACVPIMATFEAYASEQGIKHSTAAEWRSMLKALVRFIGHEDAARLTVADVDSWRDALLKEPGRSGKLRNPVTVKDKYLCCLRATLAWAVEKRLLALNVASNVKVRIPKASKVRERDFSGDEARSILVATISEHEGCNEYDRRARRWVPWLCAYTGARVNEISQLRGSDIRMVDDVWVVNIKPEAGTVKNNEARTVPLHRHIVEQGFLSIALSSGGEPIFYDQQRIKSPSASNRYFKKVGERLRDWIRNDVGITDAAVQPNHGWRHTFKTRAIDAGVPERVADAIQGHAPRSIGQTYGAVSLAAKVKAIEAMPCFEVKKP